MPGEPGIYEGAPPWLLARLARVPHRTVRASLDRLFADRVVRQERDGAMTKSSPPKAAAASANGCMRAGTTCGYWRWIERSP